MGQPGRLDKLPDPIRLARMVNEIGTLVTVGSDPVGPHPARLDGERDSQATRRRRDVARQSSSPTRRARGGRRGHRRRALAHQSRSPSRRAEWGLEVPAQPVEFTEEDVMTLGIPPFREDGYLPEFFGRTREPDRRRKGLVEVVL